MKKYQLITYTIEEYDTLSSIALRHQTNVDDIVTRNRPVLEHILRRNGYASVTWKELQDVIFPGTVIMLWGVPEKAEQRDCIAESITMEDALKGLRRLGWVVAVHNDYRMQGKAMTFWVFTHENGRYLRTEGPVETDLLGPLYSRALTDKALGNEA